MKLDFEIAVDQQTRACGVTFGGGSGFRVPTGQPHPYVVNFDPILTNHLNMLKTMLWGTLLVATNLLNTYTKFYQNWIKIEL